MEWEDGEDAASDFCRGCWPAGYSVLAPDLRAHGESGGETVTYGLLEKYDTLQWVDWLHGQGCGRVYGMGESMGASILIMAAGLHPEQHVFQAIIAECAFADLLEAAEQRGQALFPLPEPIAAPLAKFSVAGGSLYARFAKGLDFTESSPVQSIRKLDTPVLLIHGLADTRTPASHSQELAAANPEHTKLWLVLGARHVGSYTTAPMEYRKTGCWSGLRRVISRRRQVRLISTRLFRFGRSPDIRRGCEYSGQPRTRVVR
ncbi:MAG: alpha/beta hydrolase [Acidobacteriota bacterium]